MEQSNIRIVSQCVIDLEGNIVAERPEDWTIIVARCKAYITTLETDDLHTYDHKTRTITCHLS